jgi:hypothetical protein
MDLKPTRIKNKHYPGLVWRPTDLSKNIESVRANPQLFPALQVAAQALEKHVQAYFRDFGASELASKENQRMLEQTTVV